VEEVPDYVEEEIIHCGIVYGRETLDMMRKKGLVPPSDFKLTHEKARRERELFYTEGGNKQMHEERKRDINESIEKLKVRGRY